jgi:ABC-type lipoprotein release transport system permease subunit
MIKDAVSLNAGHIQIHENGFWENQTIDYAFLMTDKLKRRLSEDKRIAGYCPRIQAGGLLSFRENTAPAMIQGIDPVKEKGVSELHKKVIKGGRYLVPADGNKIVIGMTLAKNLEAGIGDTISMISQGFDGSIAAENLEIAGIINTGNPEYDRMLILMPIAAADRVFSMMNYLHAIAIKLADSADMQDVEISLLKAVDSRKIEVMGWDRLIPELVQFIAMDDMSAYIFNFILFMIVAFGILNTIQMSVFERTREFGIMLAIGTSPGNVIKMIMLESFFITVIGAALGVLLGYVLCYYFRVNPLNFTGYSDEMAAFGMTLTLFPADATALNYTVTAILTFVLSMLFSIFPARMASKLNPIKAIRQL